MFLETSAKTGENVEEAFLKCSKTILAKIETGMLYPREDNGHGVKSCREFVWWPLSNYNRSLLADTGYAE
jgi:GTPase SAR1 family protein